MGEVNDILVATAIGTTVQTDIRLGVPHDVVASLLPSALKAFHLDYPETNVTSISDSTSNLIQMIDKHQVDLALTTDNNRVSEAQLIQKARLVWVGAKKGTAFLKKPLPVAVGQEGCSFRQAASNALVEKNIAWWPVTQVRSLEPVYATLLADIAIAPFMEGTNPAGTEPISKGLPSLPRFYIHLRRSKRSTSAVSEQLIKTLLDHMAD